MSNITLAARDGGAFNAYIAMPAKTPAPTVIVIQEIFGVNEGIRKKCDWLASEGFIAVAPDIYWRIEPDIQLTDQTPEEWEKALDLMNRLDMEMAVEDLRATRHAFRGHADSTGQVGAIGYCLGGKLVYLLGCQSDIDACVAYHGVGLENLLAQADNLKHPMMLQMPEEDEYVPEDAQQKIKNALAGNDFVTIHSYPGLKHAFTRYKGQNYDEAGAQLADKRTLDFLKRNLGL